MLNLTKAFGTARECRIVRNMTFGYCPLSKESRVRSWGGWALCAVVIVLGTGVQAASVTSPDGAAQQADQVKFPKPASPAGVATLPPGAVPLPMPPNAVQSVVIGDVVAPVTLPPGVVKQLNSGAEIKYFAVPPGTVRQIAVSEIPGFVQEPVGRTRTRWPYFGGGGLVVAAVLMTWAVRRRRSVAI